MASIWTDYIINGKPGFMEIEITECFSLKRKFGFEENILFISYGNSSIQ